MWSGSRLAGDAGEPVATLNDAGRGSAGSRHRRRWTGAFVVAQVSLALVLLTGATLMMQNLMSLVRVDVGVETSGLMQTTFDLRRSGDTRERRLAFLGQLEERLASSADVNTALASNAPMGGALVRRLRIDGRPVSDPRDSPLVSLISVGQRYFDVVGAAVIAGRAFAANDLRAERRQRNRQRAIRVHAFPGRAGHRQAHPPD